MWNRAIVGPSTLMYYLVVMRAITLRAIWATGFVAVLGAVCLPAVTFLPEQAVSSSSGWLQWGGPSRDFIVGATGLAETWPEGGPRVVWTRPLGPGHSSILVDEGMLFTMYRVGNGRARQGPWDAAESVVALDAATGKTIWEHKYPAKIEDFSFGAGPHSTPLIVGNRLFTIGTNKQLFAFEKKSGKVLWSHDLIAELERAVASDPAGREGRLRVQPDRVSRHDHLLGRRTRAVGRGVPAERWRYRLEERGFPGVGDRADPDHPRRAASNS